MSQPANRRSRVVAVMACATILAVNIVAVILPHTFVLEWIARGFESQGMGIDKIDLERVLIGVFYAELGCLLLWTLISSLALHYKLAICFGGAFLIEVLSQLSTKPFGDMSYFTSQRLLNLFLYWMIRLTAMMASMAIAVRLSYKKIRFVKLGEASDSNRQIGVSLFQVLYLMSLLALILASQASTSAFLNAYFEAAKVTSAAKEIPIQFFALATFQSSLMKSVMLLVGLLIAIRCSVFWMQLILGLLATGIVTILLYPTHFSGLDSALLAIVEDALPVLSTIIWLRIVQSIGYAVRCFDRKPKHDAAHPFMEHEAAKESAFE